MPTPGKNNFAMIGILERSRNMQLEAIILNCIRKLNGERTPSNAFHLLKGKKSIQTLQDARIYQLEDYYGICGNIPLTLKSFDQLIDRMLHAGFLSVPEDNNKVCLISDRGNSWLKDSKGAFYDEYFHGLKYNDMDGIFYLRLLLLIQTLTNMKMGNNRFMPVTDKPEVESFVRQLYKRLKPKEEKALSQLHFELHTLMSGFPDTHAHLFTDRLTGHNRYGLSTAQLSMKHGIDQMDVMLILNGMVHRIMDTVNRDKAAYPMLYLLKKDLSEPTLISQSAHRTRVLLNQGYSAGQISSMRKLKENTIQDHIVEIALYDEGFSIDNFLSPSIQETLSRILKNNRTYKLKDIKSQASEEISYFQIRLYLAVNQKSLQVR